MKTEIQPTTPDDLDGIAALLAAAFATTIDALFVNRDLLAWKYFARGLPWDGARSYVMKRADEILAHCAFSPLILERDGAQVTSFCFMDWAGKRDAPGAGVLLKKRLMNLVQTSIVAGGTDATRSVIPRLGFTLHSENRLYARVVRPFRQSRARPSEGIKKDAARLLRNAAWSASSSGNIPHDWSAARVDSFDSANEIFHASNNMTNDAASKAKNALPCWTPRRDAALLNYWLSSPAAKFTGFVIREGARARGHFLLSHVAGQTRIADVRVDSTGQTDWTNAYRLASRAAAAMPETCEIYGIASTQFARAAFETSGFRWRGVSPLFLNDSQHKINDEAIFWNLIDDDTAYIHDSSHPFST